jgi:hypothetical protein
MEVVGLFYSHLVYLRPFGIFCDHLVYCMYGYLVYLSPFWYVVPLKIWQPCIQGYVMCAGMYIIWAMRTGSLMVMYLGNTLHRYIHILL